MLLTRRLYHQGLARLARYWPALSKKLVKSFTPLEATAIPWTPVTKPLAESKVAVVTTAGIHHKGQNPFEMGDAYGDPTFRTLDSRTIANDYKITHDYYDHGDADRDLNVVFPITRLKEMQAAGCIGALSEKHFGFMGHIKGPHVATLVQRTAPQVAHMLKEMAVDVVLLIPA
jgi:D-proline reductase (dithiol) PrdB